MLIKIDDGTYHPVIGRKDDYILIWDTDPVFSNDGCKKGILYRRNLETTYKSVVDFNYTKTEEILEELGFE